MWRCSSELKAEAENIHESGKEMARHYIGMYIATSSSLWNLNAFFHLYKSFEVVLVLQNFGKRFLKMNHTEWCLGR